MTDRLAVLGSPIAHSQSPQLHRCAYDVLGLDWDYSRFDVEEDGFTSFLASLDSSWRGLSLTMPLKRIAFDTADTRDDDSTVTSAVNTLVLRDGIRHGFNTDVEGIVRAVHGAGRTQAGELLIYGAGATAASTLVAATRLHATHVTVAVRSPHRARPLEQLSRQLGLPMTIRRLGDSEDGPCSDLVVSTLPGGVPLPESPSPDVVRRALLLDVAYSPWPSPLARHWHERSGTVINGLSMLVHQALLQIRLFSGRDVSAPLPAEQEVLDAMFASLDLPPTGIAASVPAS